MILTLRDRVARGEFADIFAPPPRDRAFKLFRRITGAQLVNAERFIFDSEVHAYQLIEGHPHLKRYAPEFFGVTPVSRVQGACGQDLSRRYCVGLCYSMEYLSPDPDERKFGMFFGTPEWPLVEPIGEAFQAIGVSSIGDASVLHWRNGRPRFIDFATYEAAAQHWRWE